MPIFRTLPKRVFQSTAVVFFFLLLLQPPLCHAKKGTPETFDKDRNRLISLILSQQLPTQHFSHEALDDNLSKKAYDLYLRQLDPRKRFLLQQDVKQLNAFSTYIDDELSRGRVVLPDAGMEVLNDRIRLVDNLIDPILAAGFDLDKEETLEIDPKKLDFAKNIKELKERWRLTLKMQVLETYIEDFEAEQKKQQGKAVAAAPKITAKKLKIAVDKVRESTHRALNRLLQQSRQDHYDRYFDSVARAFDPHTDYMPPTSKEDFDIQMSGSLEGIGAMLREDEGLIKVIRIIPGSAAEKQGQLQAEDTILSVAEKDGEPIDITEMRIREAVSYIRGPKGTEVRLTVQKPDGSKMIIPIIRDVVQIEETYVKSTVITAPGKKESIGYLRIPSFYRDFTAQSNGEQTRNVSDDTLAELIKLKQKNIKGLILDLRNNGGGALTDAVKISGLFIPGGPVVQVKDSQGSIRVLEDEDRDVSYTGPMIVLVNQFSASASEILAAALQDYNRALIIGGKHTHGKGTVQAMLDMNRNLPLLHLQQYEDLGALKLTIQKFYRINGGSTQYKGVLPDLVVPSMFDHLESGEQYIDYSLPWDHVDKVGYDLWNGSHFSLSKAQQDGEKWVLANKAFQKIKEESEEAAKRGKQTDISISLASMWSDRVNIKNLQKEAEAAGLMQNDPEETEQPEKEKSLDEQLTTDPFVQVSLFLMEDAAVKGATLGLSR